MSCTRLLPTACALFSILPLVTSCSQAQPDAAKSVKVARPVAAQLSSAKNLVQNPGFENGEESYSIPSGLAAPNAQVVKIGKGSLKLSNNDASKYRWVAQTISITSGGKYRFSAQIKGESLVSAPDAESNRGAGIFLEWYDAAGNWLGGSYPECKLGNFDWTRLEGEGDLPLNAHKMILGLYLRKGTTGTAYFDDLNVNSTTPLLRVFLTSPNYHGFIAKGDQSDWEALLSVNRAPGLPINLSVRSQVVQNGKVVKQQIVPVAARKAGEDESAQLTLIQPYVRSSAPSAKTLVWKIDVVNDAQQSMASHEFMFRVLDSPLPVAIAKSGIWMVGGKPFFPLGIYLGAESDASDADLQRIADAGFNTVLNYAYGAGTDPVGFLDRAQKHGLKVIFSLKDFTETSYEFPKSLGKTPAQLISEYVQKVKNHPALLAWYLNDEGGLEHEDEFRSMQNQVLSLDNHSHPIIDVLNQYGSLDGYYDLTDVMGVDPYPIPQFTFDIVPQWADAAKSATRNAKSALLVTQAFSYEVYPPTRPGSRYPTTDELRCMNLLGLISKPNGVLFYAYMDLWMKDAKRDKTMRDEAKFAREWAKVSTVSRELKTLTPTLLSGKDVDLQAKNSLPTQLRFRAIQDGKTTKLIVANADAKNSSTLSFASTRFSVLRQQTGNVVVQKKAGQWLIQVPPHGSAILLCE